MNIAIVLAGGVGARTGLEIPKQFYKIRDMEILSYTLTAFESSEKIDKIVIVSLEEYFDKISEIVRKYDVKKHIMTVKNGDTRKQSVFNALKSLENIASQDDIVLVHDGIRSTGTLYIIYRHLRVLITNSSMMHIKKPRIAEI